MNQPNLQELQDGLKAEIQAIDTKIKRLQDNRVKTIRKAQEIIKREWNNQSQIKKGARVAIGPKVYEVDLRFTKSRPVELVVNVVELTKAMVKKESYTATHSLRSILQKHEGIEFVNPDDPNYNKVRGLNPAKMKSYQGFNVGQKVWFYYGSSWHRTKTTGTINNFTPTGKVTVVYGRDGHLKETLNLSNIKPTNQDQ